jgi:proline iminopeptidase
MTMTQREREFGLLDGTPDETGFADVPGGKAWWRRVGAAGKTPLLLLHGGPGAGHNYLLPFLALSRDRPVIFYDQLGCGRSDGPADEAIYTIQRAVDEVDAVRAALGLERIVLFGNSWGSMLAIEYMCQGRGAGVEKLILSGALASIPQTVAGMRRWIAAMPGGERLMELEAAAETGSDEYAQLTQRFYDRHVCRAQPTPPEVAESLAIAGSSIAYRVMNGPNEFTIVGVIKDWDRRADLGRISVPTYITMGEFDEVDLECHRTLHQGIAASVFEIFPGASHMTMNEDPEAYVAAVGRFIDG